MCELCNGTWIITEGLFSVGGKKKEAAETKCLKVITEIGISNEPMSLATYKPFETSLRDPVDI